MKWIIIKHWDEQIWRKANVVYVEAFGKQGVKTTPIIRNMFEKQLCFLHLVVEESGDDFSVIGMALTGKLPSINAILIDYLAIQKSYRNKGIGFQLVEFIKNWSRSKMHYNSIIVEVEAIETQINFARIQFWKKCGFQLTDYIHKYIWVPEGYQAMVQSISPHTNITTDGKVLFKHISHFHKKSYQGV